MPVIRISEKTLKRLEKYAEGFMSPSEAIERVLNNNENLTALLLEQDENIEKGGE